MAINRYFGENCVILYIQVIQADMPAAPGSRPSFGNSPGQRKVRAGKPGTGRKLRRWRIGLAAITTEGDEMRRLVKPPQTTWHEPSLLPLRLPSGVTPG